MARCLARQESDQFVCRKCGLAWDVNDPEPPACPTLFGVVETPRAPTPPAAPSRYQQVRYTTARALIDRAYRAGREHRTMDDIIEELQRACGQ